MDDELQSEVRKLLASGAASTNHIARTLGVPRGRVAPLVRAIGRDQRSRADGPPPVHGCWVSAGWSDGLTVERARDWPDRHREGADTSGLVGVVVARETRRAGDDVSVCGYLVDTYCLGVKDALGPRVMRRRRLPGFLDGFFDAFGGGPVVAPIELAGHLVWGSVAYARELGFEPHPDLRRAAGHLPMLSEPCAVRFGDRGRPFYIQGPHDDTERILRTLDRTTGRDNYHFLVGAGAFELT